MFLAALAVRQRVSASTQNQALAALTFLYDAVLRRPLERVDGIVPARRSRRVPVVLSAGEVRALLERMTDPARLCATIMYGSGLRVLECVSLRVKDASEYLAGVGLAVAPGELRATVAYDDPCHLIHGQKISAQPRALLAAIPGLTLVPLAEADWCCGSAGTYNVTQPDLARRLGHRKAEHVRGSNAEMVVTANPGCQMQIEAALRREGSRIPVVHLMDLLDRAYG